MRLFGNNFTKKLNVIFWDVLELHTKDKAVWFFRGVSVKSPNCVGKDYKWLAIGRLNFQWEFWSRWRKFLTVDGCTYLTNIFYFSRSLSPEMFCCKPPPFMLYMSIFLTVKISLSGSSYLGGFSADSSNGMMAERAILSKNLKYKRFLDYHFSDWDSRVIAPSCSANSNGGFSFAPMK